MERIDRNNLKNREFAKEAPQDFCLERTTIASRQGVSEDKNPEGKLTSGSPTMPHRRGEAPAKTNSSGYFGLTLLILFLFLGGCNLKPSYSRPEMAIGESFRFDLPNTVEYANIAWWKQFQDPTLDLFIDTALKNNQDLQVASARILEFYAKYRIYFSQFFPQVGAVGFLDHMKLSEDINFLPLPPGVPRVNNLYDLFFQFSYEIDFWGKIRNATESAKATYLGEINARRNVIVSLVSSVASTYILLKQYIRQLKISQLTYESRMGSLDIAQRRYDAGIVSDLEVQQAKSEMLAADIQIKNFEVMVAKQEDLLSVLMGQAPRPLTEEISLNVFNHPPSIPAGLPSDLLENRPDILQAEQRILAANADVGVARAAFLPSFSLTGTFGQMSTATETLFQNSANFFDVAVKAFEPLFTGWKITNQLKESEAVLLQALHAYQQTILTALKEVNDALIEHKKAEEKLILQESRVASLEEYLKLAKLRYFNGQNDYLTVLDAEKSLFQTQLEEAASKADLYLSLVALYKSLGQGWDVE